jgi:hypothetical protein
VSTTASDNDTTISYGFGSDASANATEYTIGGNNPKRYDDRTSSYVTSDGRLYILVQSRYFDFGSTIYIAVEYGDAPGPHISSFNFNDDGLASVSFD